MKRSPPALFSFLLVLMLTSCARYYTMETVTPNTPAARFNAEQAIAFLQKGCTDLALEKLHLASEQAPNDPLVLDAWGYYYEKGEGNISRANSAYLGAYLQAPNSGTIINNYAAFLCRNGYYGASIPYFLKAAQTHYPGSQQSLANARHCLKHIDHGLGDASEYAYYSKLLGPIPLTRKPPRHRYYK